MSTADRLVEIARADYSFGVSLEGDAFMSHNRTPHLALTLSSSRLRSSLAAAYHRTHGSTPAGSALSEALAVLEGDALAVEPEELHLRVAEYGGLIWLDLGRRDGQVVRIDKSGWVVTDTCPVRFRRTKLTGEMSIPTPGDVQKLADYINVREEDFDLLVGVLVASFIPGIPHPVTVLRGPQGAGKSFAARACIDLIDPSPAPFRTPPSRRSDWAVAVSASWGACFDNVSSLPDWLSDAICKAVTGDGYVTRMLYTDNDVVVHQWKRVIFINGIDFGPLRGDLADRSVTINLTPIDGTQRCTEEELGSALGDSKAAILGGLLDLLSRVLALRDHIRLERKPRMADFAVILAAVDIERRTNALPRFEAGIHRELIDALDGDPVCAAIRRLMEDRTEWQGTASDLDRALEHDDPPGWPKSPSALSQRLNRVAPLLEQAGIQVAGRLHDAAGNRQIRISKSDPSPSGASRTATS